MPVYESDDDLRRRIQLADEQLNTAGSRGSYVSLTLNADQLVKDADAISPDDGLITVYVLSRTGDGTADETLISTVEAALNDEDARPMTDNVTVLSATIVEYSIEAEITVYPGPDAAVVLANAIAAAQSYADSTRKMGYDIKLSAVYAALHQPGVQHVDLSEPAADITVDQGEASYCTLFDITLAGAPDV